MGLLLRNWHLKLSAVLLATVLYTGLVFSGSFATSTIAIRVDFVNQPPNSYVLTGDLGLVQIEYRAPREIIGGIVEEAFVARVDLSDYDMAEAPDPQFLDVDVRALNDDIEITSEPQTVRVEIDRIDQRIVPVEVDVGEVPETLSVGRPETSDEEVQVRGPASIVARVDRAVALVNVDASGIDIDRPVDLQPVDVSGQPLGDGLLDLLPGTVSVRLDVEPVEETLTVPVRPAISGTPAAGFALEALTVEPSTVTLRGLPEVLAEVTEILTEDLSISGLSDDETFDAALVLPDGVTLADDELSVSVEATIGPSVSSRTFVVGVVCANAGDNACLPGLDRLSVTLSGTADTLSSLTAGALTPTVDAGGLDPGSHALTPVLPGLPDGVELESVNPGSVPVTIVAPAAPTAAATPAPTPTAEP